MPKSTDGPGSEAVLLIGAADGSKPRCTVDSSNTLGGVAIAISAASVFVRLALPLVMGSSCTELGEVIFSPLSKVTFHKYGNRPRMPFSTPSSSS